MNQLSLSRQLEVVFREIRSELSQLQSGTVIIHFRDNMIGKFGVKHNPIVRENFTEKVAGLNDTQQALFLRMGKDIIQRKTNWSHGEIQLDFMLRKGQLCASAQLESNYNLSKVIKPPSGPNNS